MLCPCTATTSERTRSHATPHHANTNTPRDATHTHTHTHAHACTAETRAQAVFIESDNCAKFIIQCLFRFVRVLQALLTHPVFLFLFLCVCLCRGSSHRAANCAHPTAQCLVLFCSCAPRTTFFHPVFFCFRVLHALLFFIRCFSVYSSLFAHIQLSSVCFCFVRVLHALLCSSGVFFCFSCVCF